jgi:hypothetical protein
MSKQIPGASNNGVLPKALLHIVKVYRRNILLITRRPSTRGKLTGRGENDCRKPKRHGDKCILEGELPKEATG